MKQQAIEIVELQFKLKIKLLDDLLETIWDYRKEWLKYQDIAKKMKVTSSVLTKLTKPDLQFIEWLKNKTLATWLNNLKSN